MTAGEAAASEAPETGETGETGATRSVSDSNPGSVCNVLSLFDGISCARLALERTWAARARAAHVASSQDKELAAGVASTLASTEGGSDSVDIESSSSSSSRRSSSQDTQPRLRYFTAEICPYAEAVVRKNWPDTVALGDVCKIEWDAATRGPLTLLVGGSPCTDLTKAGKKAGLEGQYSRLFWEYVRILKTARPRWFLFENVASMPTAAAAAITDALGVEPILVDASGFAPCARTRLWWTNIPVPAAALAEVQQRPRGNGQSIADILLPPSADLVAQWLDPSRIHWHAVEARNPSGMIRVGYAGTPRSRIYSPEGILPSLTQTLGTVWIRMPDGRVRNLDMREVEAAMGLPQDYTLALKDGAPLTRSRRSALIALGFHARVVEWIFSFVPSWTTV
jgi:hypothetical protein